MSFDLGFWWEPGGDISPEEAAQKYAAMVVPIDGVVAKMSELVDFFDEVVETHPDLTELNIDTSPWSTSLHRTDECVIVSIAYSRQREMGEFLLRVAGKHGITCFDPQSNSVHHPVSGSRATLQLANGKTQASPGQADIVSALRSITVENWYVILEREPDVYIQVGYGLAVGVSEGFFAVETREGGPDQHYRAVLGDLDKVSDAFFRFLSGDQVSSGGLGFIKIIV